MFGSTAIGSGSRGSQVDIDSRGISTAADTGESGGSK